MNSNIIKRFFVPGMIMLFGLLFAAIGSGMALRQNALEKQGVEAQGMVVALQDNYDSDGITFAAVVHFRTNSGESIEFVSSYSSKSPAYDIGEDVIVVYPPDNPAKAIIKGEGRLLLIIFILVGGCIMAVALFMVINTLRALTFLGLEG